MYAFLTHSLLLQTKREREREGDKTEKKKEKNPDIVVNVSYRHKRPCNANTNFRDNRIWKLDHFQSARIVYYHLN